MSDRQSGRIETAGLGIQVDSARLLDDIAIDISRGEFVGVVGPNGAGKSTLLRAMARLLDASDGSVSIEGVPVAKLRATSIARTLAIVGQHAPDTHGFTALEVVLTGRYPHLGRFEVESQRDRDIAFEAMQRTTTLPFADRTASSLSGGERQRVFLARGLAQGPRILLLDEPTASLDVYHQFAVMELARELAAGGMTVIAVIHDLQMAARYCDRLVLLHNGRVAADGPPGDVLTPANLEAVFGVVATVFTEPLSGRLVVDFDARRRHGPEAASMRVHLVGGCGLAAPVLRELKLAGHQVTVGPLGAGDVDRLACEATSTPYLPVPGFSPIDDETHARHQEWIAAADCAVLCDIPFGAGNLRNLEALRAARRLVSIEAQSFVARDHTGGAATALFAELIFAARCASLRKATAAIAALASGVRDTIDHDPQQQEMPA